VSAVLLDTCAILWLAAGLAPRPGVMELIEAARADDAALVSPISAWEIAQKEKKRPGSLGLAAPPLAVFERLAGQPGVRLAPLTPAILTASVALDGLGTDDPVDRMIVATSLAHSARLVTADARMLAFSAAAVDYGRPL
jgi:PIN domain nuclease of toxin-antitoxin system